MTKKRTTGLVTKDQLWQEWKSQPCSHCGQTFHWSQMDAHHSDPSDKLSDMRFSIRNLPTGKMLKELEKCIPLCKNCHAYHHWQLIQDKEN